MSLEVGMNKVVTPPQLQKAAVQEEASYRNNVSDGSERVERPVNDAMPKSAVVSSGQQSLISTGVVEALRVALPDAGGEVSGRIEGDDVPQVAQERILEGQQGGANPVEQAVTDSTANNDRPRVDDFLRSTDAFKAAENLVQDQGRTNAKVQSDVGAVANAQTIAVVTELFAGGGITV